MVKKCASKLFVNVPVNDNAIFAVCTKGTSILLCVLLNCIALAYYINGKIECKKRHASMADISEEMINKLCYINGTFNVHSPKEAFDYYGTAFESLYYYQDGWIYLLWQAVIAFFPFYLWKVLEGGRLKVLSKDLSVPIIDRDVKEKRVSQLAEYMNVNINYHNSYAYKFFLCEILCLGVTIGQIYFLNYLLNGQFFAYGWNVILHDHDVINPAAEIFPLVATCYFYYFSSPEIAACILPLNGVYDKVFFILWCWFGGIAVLTLFSLVYRLVICLSPKIRTLLLTSIARLPIEKETEPALDKLKIGDFFLLHQLSRNVNATAFKEIIQRLINQTSPYKQMSISLDQDSLEETGTV